MSVVSIFSIIDTVCLCQTLSLISFFFNEQQIYLATLWSALMFQCINSLNIAQFVMKMRSSKNHKMKHSRKMFCGLEGFSLSP